MQELQTYTEKALTLDSREVAEMTGKEHKNLLRDIKSYVDVLTSSNLSPLTFFIESTYSDSKGETRPCYQLTKKGCDMVANKMTGEKGIKFTAQYIDKFYQMESQIKYPKLSKELQAIFVLDEKAQVMESRIENLENNMTIDYSQQLELKLIANKRVLEVLGGKDTPAYKEVGKKAFRSIWTDFQKALGVNSYRNTAVKNYEVAKKYVSEWNPNRELELMILGSNSQLRIVE